MEKIQIVFLFSTIISPVYLRSSISRLCYEPVVTNENNCLCYPSNNIYTPVPEVLDVTNNGLERVVVYIYKDVQTNIIKMYTPNAWKQSSIPDLPFEIGDSIVLVTQEMAKEVFENNPHKIMLNRSSSIVKFNQEDSSYQTNIIIDEIGTSQKEVEFETINNIQQGTNSIDGYLNISPYTIPSNNNLQTEAWLVNIEGSWYQGGKNWENTLQGFQKLYDTNNVNSKGNKQYSIFETNIVSQNDHIITIPIKETQHYVTFDDWFIRQMKIIRSTNQLREMHSMNIVTLKSLIKKMLRENNIHVTVEGVLIDKYGVKINYANLELTPLVLGNFVAHNKVLNGFSEQLSMIKDLPYLEAILVSTVHPPKVLGIIPLGKPYRSHDSDKWLLKEKNTTVEIHVKDTVAGEIESGLNNFKIDTTIGAIDANLPYVVERGQVVSEKRSDQPVIKHQHLAKKKKKNRHVKKGKVNSSKVDESTQMTEHQSQRDMIANILKKLNEVLSTTKHGRVDYDTETYENIEDLPDFRIIGGNAATSSGAPVSSKGRSGIDV